MALTNSTDYEQAWQRAREVQDRARAKRKARLSDQAWLAAQRDKQRVKADQARQERLDLLRDPAYQAAQRLKREQAQEKARKRKQAQIEVAPCKPSKPTSRKSSRGLKGRTPSADERRVMDAMGALPCVCCLRRGRVNPVVSLHHVTGRTEPGAHYRVLPLCIWHHDTPADPAELARFPDLVPYHAKGAEGGPAAWRAEFGREVEVLIRAWELAGLTDKIPAMLGPLAEELQILGELPLPKRFV